MEWLSANSDSTSCCCNSQWLEVVFLGVWACMCTRLWCNYFQGASVTLLYGQMCPRVQINVLQNHWIEQNEKFYVILTHTHTVKNWPGIRLRWFSHNDSTWRRWSRSHDSPSHTNRLLHSAKDDHQIRDTAPNIPRKLSPSEVRAKVVEEILNTERDYVQHLEDIVEVSFILIV